MTNLNHVVRGDECLGGPGNGNSGGIHALVNLDLGSCEVLQRLDSLTVFPDHSANHQTLAPTLNQMNK